MFIKTFDNLLHAKYMTNNTQFQCAIESNYQVTYFILRVSFILITHSIFYFYTGFRLLLAFLLNRTTWMYYSFLYKINTNQSLHHCFEF